MPGAQRDHPGDHRVHFRISRRVDDFHALDVKTACGSDMMSDVLAFVKDQSVLLTGLMNPQVVRTAEMMDMHCIVFVRGKKIDPNVVALARQKEITVLASPYRMFTACGLLYSNGLRGGCEIQ